MPSLTVNFSRLEGGFSIWKPAQRYCVYLLMGNQDCAPRLNNLLLLTVSSRCCILSLPQLTTARIYPLELSKGHGGWMKAIFCNQRNGRHRKSLCPGDPQDPAQYLKEVLVPGASLPYPTTFWGVFTIELRRPSFNCLWKHDTIVSNISFPAPVSFLPRIA